MAVLVQLLFNKGKGKANYPVASRHSHNLQLREWVLISCSNRSEPTASAHTSLAARSTQSRGQKTTPLTTPSAVCLHNPILNGLLLIYRLQKDERLNWPRWLTHSREFTHKVAMCPASGQVQYRESSPVIDQRSTTVLHNQLIKQHISKTDINNTGIMITLHTKTHTPYIHYKS